jgi:hypothetical protein
MYVLNEIVANQRGGSMLKEKRCHAARMTSRQPGGERNQVSLFRVLGEKKRRRLFEDGNHLSKYNDDIKDIGIRRIEWTGSVWVID